MLPVGQLESLLCVSEVLIGPYQLTIVIFECGVLARDEIWKASLGVSEVKVSKCGIPWLRIGTSIRSVRRLRSSRCSLVELLLQYLGGLAITLDLAIAASPVWYSDLSTLSHLLREQVVGIT